MCSLFILQPNAVLYEVHTWKLHSQLTEYESRFCTRMLSWGASNLWATWFPQFLAILTIHQVPGHHKEERKGGLSSLNIIRWQEKSGQRPGFSHTPPTPPIFLLPVPLCSGLSDSDFHPEPSSVHRRPLCRQMLYYLQTHCSFCTVFLQSWKAETLKPL